MTTILHVVSHIIVHVTVVEHIAATCRHEHACGCIFCSRRSTCHWLRCLFSLTCLTSYMSLYVSYTSYVLHASLCLLYLLRLMCLCVSRVSYVSCVCRLACVMHVIPLRCLMAHMSVLATGVCYSVWGCCCWVDYGRGWAAEVWAVNALCRTAQCFDFFSGQWPKRQVDDDQLDSCVRTHTHLHARWLIPPSFSSLPPSLAP